MQRERTSPVFYGRLVVVGAFYAMGLAVLLIRLWVVQVRDGPQHTQAIARQSIRLIRVNPVRGRMFSTDGEVLVDNAPSYALIFHISEMRHPGARSKTVAYIWRQACKAAGVIGRPIPFPKTRIQRRLEMYPALPLVVLTDLTVRELARLEELWPPIPGMEIVCGLRRRYPWPGLAPHVLGFAGRRMPQRDSPFGRYGYVTLDLRGRSGLELEYDRELAGSAGTRIVRVDTLGYVHRVIGKPVEPTDGNDLLLTLDRRAQESAQRALVSIHGALVALDVRSGAVLAMASSPGYDLGSLDARTYAALAENVEARPLLNRAVAAGYLPGSIVKPLIGLAALNAGAVRPDETINCTGKIRIGDHPIHCWLHTGHGPLTLVEALEHSCNVYFIEAGLRTGLERLQPVLAAAGIGQDPRLDLPHSPAATRGRFPHRPARAKHSAHGWSAIDTAYISIGQGPINLSPLQAAMYTAAIANGGLLYRPHLLRQIRAPDGRVLRNIAPEVLHRFPGPPEHLALIREGMWRVVNGEHATASRARTDVISLAGKTGTAEVQRKDGQTKNTWFVCFGPWESPRYAVAVLVENGVSGGKSAAPLARRFLEGWLRARPRP